MAIYPQLCGADGQTRVQSRISADRTQLRFRDGAAAPEAILKELIP